MTQYTIRFFSFDNYENGRVEVINTNEKKYPFPNFFEIVNNFNLYGKIVFWFKRIYVFKTVGKSIRGWVAAEFATCRPDLAKGLTAITPICLQPSAPGPDTSELGRYRVCEWDAMIREHCRQYYPLKIAGWMTPAFYVKRLRLTPADLGSARDNVQVEHRLKSVDGLSRVNHRVQ